MAGFVDFDEIKRNTTFVQVIALLGLQLKRQSGTQWRGPCPACKSGGDRALVITEGKGFYCFAQKVGGDQIALVGHIKDLKPREAAQFLAGTVPENSTSPRNSPESGVGNEPKKFGPLPYLEPGHVAVDAIGFDTDFAKKHGIGYAPKGTMRGYVLAPFRDEQGNLLGYIGLGPDTKLPADFTPNVVPFEKKSA